mmetsp:Transcript_64126/g.198575  ORF Transcript_64126/g.198575 Transcript_64126/m.198575 type:complete len:375 (+) Transcript_64126:655-1779(+)
MVDGAGTPREEGRERGALQDQGSPLCRRAIPELLGQCLLHEAGRQPGPSGNDDTAPANPLERKCHQLRQGLCASSQVRHAAPAHIDRRHIVKAEECLERLSLFGRPEMAPAGAARLQRQPVQHPLTGAAGLDGLHRRGVIQGQLGEAVELPLAQKQAYEGKGTAITQGARNTLEITFESQHECVTLEHLLDRGRRLRRGPAQRAHPVLGTERHGRGVEDRVVDDEAGPLPGRGGPEGHLHVPRADGGDVGQRASFGTGRFQGPQLAEPLLPESVEVTVEVGRILLLPGEKGGHLLLDQRRPPRFVILQLHTHPDEAEPEAAEEAAHGVPGLPACLAGDALHEAVEGRATAAGGGHVLVDGLARLGRKRLQEISP